MRCPRAGTGLRPAKSCADKTATAYLTTGRLPAADVTCRATPAAEPSGPPAADA
ncbi:alpha/beta hydrolase [Streptomyces sp. NPDC058718]|uniref:alpha/beta hydrolase n=1 Tax=Streptomyces sp. NPDC058718 TaxID=3346610 RepID=UPI0036B79B7C